MAIKGGWGWGWGLVGLCVCVCVCVWRVGVRGGGWGVQTNGGICWPVDTPSWITHGGLDKMADILQPTLSIWFLYENPGILVQFYRPRYSLVCWQAITQIKVVQLHWCLYMSTRLNEIKRCRSCKLFLESKKQWNVGELDCSYKNISNSSRQIRRGFTLCGILSFATKVLTWFIINKLMIKFISIQYNHQFT